MIALGQLIDTGVAPTQARLMLPALQAACARFDIASPARLAAFVGQCMVESAGFTRLEENCNWTSPERILRFFPSRVSSLQQASALARNPKALANCVYSGKNGNGNPLTGDGWTFRGRGLIGLTGRANYFDTGQGVGRPYLAQPDLVGLPDDAALSSAFFWHVHKLNILADSWQIDAITRAVNGPGMSDHALRLQYSEQGQKAFSAATTTP